MLKVIKQTKTQRKSNRLQAKLQKDSKFQGMLEVLSKGHEKMMNFIDRGIKIQALKVGK